MPMRSPCPWPPILDLWPILRFWPYFEVRLRCKPGSFFWSFLGHFVSFRVILGHFGSSWVILGHLGTFGVIFGPHWAILGHWQKLTGPMCFFAGNWWGFFCRPTAYISCRASVEKKTQIVQRPQEFGLVSRAKPFEQESWFQQIISNSAKNL